MPVVIQVFSDYVCPYCYLGEVALRKAVAATGADVVHRAYQLRESGPPKLEPRGERMNAIWKNSIYPMAEALGVKIRQPSQVPLTRLAHEAAAWARHQGCFEQFHQRLFDALFVDDKDLSELSVLKDIAWQSGLNPDELKKALTENRMAEEVDEDLLIAQTYGISSIPTFVIAGHPLSGIQDQRLFIKAIELAQAGELEAEACKLPHLPISITR